MNKMNKMNNVIKYLYLLEAGDRFKVGYTLNPKRRLKEYRTHNTISNILGIFRVKDKSMEKSVHLELLKKGYTRCKQPEWFIGKMTILELENIIKCIEYKIKLTLSNINTG